MATEIGEAREKWGSDVWQMVEDFANAMKSEVRPFYVVYACKPDRNQPNAFRQTVKAYYQRPPAMLGILVWYVDHSQSRFEFVPELSAPMDIPLDAALLSTQASDAFGSVAEQGKKMKVLVS